MTSVALLTLNLLSLANCQTLTFNDTFNNNGDDFEFDITVDDTTTSVRIASRSGVYISIGFGSTSMDDTYTIVAETDGSVYEHRLDRRTSDEDLNECDGGSCLTDFTYLDNGDQTIVTFSRLNSPSTDSDDIYIFSNSDATLSLIWAYGISGNLGPHSSRNGELITYNTGEAVDVGDVDFYSVIVEVDELDMIVELVLNDTTMLIEMEGPSDRWFAINWGGHNDGDCLAYTTGRDDDLELNAYDCHLGAQQTTTSQNDVDDNQDWTILNIQDLGDSVRVIAIRDRISDDSDDNSWDYPPAIEEYYFATGQSSDDYSFTYHGTSQTKYEINLEAGTSAESVETIFTTDEHGLLMFLAFGIFMPWGALVNRYLGFSICSKIECFRRVAYLSVQIHKTMMIISWVFCMLGFITKWADNKGLTFDTAHGTIGFICVIMSFLITFGTFMSNKENIVRARHTGIGDSNATCGHRVFGAIFVIFSLFVVLTGLNSAYGGGNIRFTLYIVYVIILIIVVIIFEIYGFNYSDSMNKAVVNDNSNNEGLPIVFEEGKTKMLNVGSTSANDPNVPTSTRNTAL